ncbi:hypothetical protein NQZ68_004914 [Dissostichus eleginoides]|nr:hypothetical protein NQZ68_004914 [Dissostichus eleginoides]
MSRVNTPMSSLLGDSGSRGGGDEGDVQVVICGSASPQIVLARELLRVCRPQAETSDLQPPDLRQAPEESAQLTSGPLRVDI